MAHLFIAFFRLRATPREEKIREEKRREEKRREEKRREVKRREEKRREENHTLAKKPHSKNNPPANPSDRACPPPPPPFPQHPARSQNSHHLPAHTTPPHSEYMLLCCRACSSWRPSCPGEVTRNFLTRQTHCNRLSRLSQSISQNDAWE